MCHRGIIAGVLDGMGAHIETSVNYRKYYYQIQAYKELQIYSEIGILPSIGLDQALKKAKKYRKRIWSEDRYRV